MRKKFSNENIQIEVDTLGAELKSLQCFAKEYIWCSDAKYWNRSAPVLFPVVGKLKGLSTIIDNKEYNIPQHGILRDLEFNYVGQINGEFVFENFYNENTLKNYPFKYKATIKYLISENKVKTTFVIENIDSCNIIFNLGGHPAINCPLNEKESFEDYTIYFEHPETFKSPKIMSDATLDFNEPVLGYTNLKKLNLKKETFVIDTIIITDVKSRSVQLLNKENEGIKFSFQNFSTFAIWTPHNAAPFICLEPWQGYNDLVDTNKQFNTKKDLVNLKPNEKYEASYTIEVVKNI